MSDAPPGLSACIITRDEEDRLGDCLESLAFCDERLVVDSHSTDATREIAAAAGARVIERDWPGYGEQKQFAITAAEHDWVLCIDADERVSPGLRAEIERLRDESFPVHAGWRMPRCSSYLGRFLRHGSWYPDRQLRLFDRRRGRWTGDRIHERVAVDGSVGELRSDLLHYPYRSFAEHLATIDRYTDIMATALDERGKQARLRHIVLNPVWRFLRYYFVKRGFLDGWRGLVMAYLEAHYARLKYTRLYVMQRAREER